MSHLPIEIPEHTATSVDEIAGIARAFRKEKAPCYFRGQARDYPLIPSLGRKRDKEPLKTVEFELIKKFMELYGQEVNESERTHPDIVVNLDDRNAWRVLAVAQHHGLPTRLLDWSECIFTATYFAVRAADRKLTGDGVVYGLWDRTAVAPDAAVRWPEVPLDNVRPYRAWKDDKVNMLPRIKWQQGAFTTQPDPCKNLLHQLNPSEHVAMKIVIPHECKHTIRAQLLLWEVNERFLFGGLDAVCRDVMVEVLGEYA
jgi:hypothetical protein